MVKSLIVVSGPPGTGSSTIARNIAKKLKLKFFSAGDLHKKMFRGWKNKEAKAALEVWKTKAGASEETHKERDNLIKTIAKEGNIVICGKLGVHFLKGMSKNKIWLDAPLTIRAERTAKRDKISIDDAKKQISLREDLERLNWKKIYGFDYFDQKNEADIVVDTSDMSVKQVVNTILEKIKRQ